MSFLLPILSKHYLRISTIFDLDQTKNQLILMSIIQMPSIGKESLLIFRDDWEYSWREARTIEFSNHANWGVVLKDATIKINLSLREQDHIGKVYSWVEQNSQAIMSEALLTRKNINCFLTIPSQSHVSDHAFLQALVSSPTHKRPSNAVLEKANKITQIEKDKFVFSSLRCWSFLEN